MNRLPFRRARLPSASIFLACFAVALGVLLDTLIVRSVLVTALNLDLKGRMWWPSPLARKDAELAAAAEAAERDKEEAVPELEPAR